MKDRKRSFWLLLIFFGLMAIMVLAINQVGITDSSSDSMMGLSMGGMMKMHAQDIKPGDLLKPIQEDHGMGDTSGHHPLSNLMQSLAFLSTITVFLFLPLIIGGSVTLLVLWF